MPTTGPCCSEPAPPSFLSSAATTSPSFSARDELAAMLNEAGILILDPEKLASYETPAVH